MKRLFSFLVVVAIAVACSAQVNLRLSLNAFTNDPPFRVHYGDTLFYSIEITNTDTNAFSGNVYVGFKGSNSLAYDSIALGFFQIAPFDTRQVLISIEVKPQYFKTGPEVVVVWPIIEGGVTGNQVADFIYVKNSLSSANEHSHSKLDYFIHNSRIKCMVCKNRLKQVRIFDYSGRLIFYSSFTDLPLSIDVPHSGIYLVELSDTEGNLFMLRWIR